MSETDSSGMDSLMDQMVLDAHFANIALITMRPESKKTEETLCRMFDLGLSAKVNVVQAVSGRAIGKPDWWPNNGASSLGCFASHLMVLLHHAASNAGNLLVLEEDVVWQEDAADRIGELMSNVPNSWDQLYLGGQHRVMPKPTTRKGVMQGQSVHRTHAYAVSRLGLPKLLKHLLNTAPFTQAKADGKKLHIDHYYEQAHRRGDWTVYVPEWWIAGQGDTYSWIRAKQVKAAWWHRMAGDPWKKRPLFWSPSKVEGLPVEHIDMSSKSSVIKSRMEAFRHQRIPLLPSDLPETHARSFAESLNVELCLDLDDISKYVPSMNQPNPRDLVQVQQVQQPQETPYEFTLGDRAKTGTPVMIFATPRSGSTLLIRLLNRIDGWSIAGEKLGLLRAVKATHDLRSALEARSPHAFNSLFQQEHDGHFPSHHAPSSKAEWDAAARDMLMAWANGGSSRYWGMKEVHLAKHGFKYGISVWTWLMEIMPDVKFILLSRNVDDTEVSMGRNLKWWVPSYGSCIGACRRQVRQQTEAFDEFATLYPNNTLRLQYEQLLDYKTFNGLLEKFVGESIDKDRFDTVLKLKLR